MTKRTMLLAAVAFAYLAFVGGVWAQGVPAVPASAAAPPGRPPLTLAEVMASVDRAYPLLMATLQRRQMALADLLVAEGGFDLTARGRGSVVGIGYYDHVTADAWLEQPTALWGSTFFGGWRLGQGRIPDYYGHRVTKPGGEVRVGVTSPVLRDGAVDRRRTQLAQAELGKEVVEGDIALFRIEMHRSAAYRFWDWVVAGRRLQIAKGLLAIAVARDEIVRVRSDLGDVATIDRLDNERAIAERQERMVASERMLEQSALALSLFLRDNEGQPVVVSPSRLPPEVPDPDAGRIDVALDKAFAQRPELRRIAALRGQTQAEHRWAENQALPALDLSLVGSRDVGPSDPMRPDLDRTEVTGALSFELPMQRRVAKGRKQAAAAALTRLAAEEQMARDRIVTEVRDAGSALRAAAQRVKLARRQRALAVKLEQAERTRFALGESTLLFVNLREQASADAALTEVEAQAAWLRAEADLDAALGAGS